MTLQSPEEIAKELIVAHDTITNAMKTLCYTRRKLMQCKSLIYPNPQLVNMEWAYQILLSLNYGKTEIE